LGLANGLSFIVGASGNLIGPTVTIQGDKRLLAKIQLLESEFGNVQQFLKTAAKAHRTFMVKNYLTGQRLRRRSGDLIRAWHDYPAGARARILTAGALPYSRVHDLGLEMRGQFVRGYTTRGGKRVRSYFRDMRQRARRYVQDTVIFGAPFASRMLDKQVNRILREKVKLA
jgi:hypothetical protein